VIHSALASILAGVSMHYACVIIGNVGDGNFRPCLYKKQYLSNGHAAAAMIAVLVSCPFIRAVQRVINTKDYRLHTVIECALIQSKYMYQRCKG